jgi:hypothetical protein
MDDSFSCKRKHRRITRGVWAGVGWKAEQPAAWGIATDDEGHRPQPLCRKQAYDADLPAGIQPMPLHRFELGVRHLMFNVCQYHRPLSQENVSRDLIPIINGCRSQGNVKNYYNLQMSFKGLPEHLIASYCPINR